jgi:hypothetical protein
MLLKNFLNFSSVIPFFILTLTEYDSLLSISAYGHFPDVTVEYPKVFGIVGVINEEIENALKGE